MTPLQQAAQAAVKEIYDKLFRSCDGSCEELSEAIVLRHFAPLEAQLVEAKKQFDDAMLVNQGEWAVLMADIQQYYSDEKQVIGKGRVQRIFSLLSNLRNQRDEYLLAYNGSLADWAEVTETTPTTRKEQSAALLKLKQERDEARREVERLNKVLSVSYYEAWNKARDERDQLDKDCQQLREELKIAADWIESCPFENAIPFSQKLKKLSEAAK